ncbi:alkylphosphocholine resistance protein lem3 [Mycoemilia scoparia]|uniref:Alkylphosphocholine resistance protein lem3 n=1 Tax=Mycoemilia scoparia TaxID=417184 RepID=A0A9W8DW83_9FUNG|nr:alkylphosphocholine resistance protein lem3 [Mycoemilia scoparia]
MKAGGNRNAAEFWKTHGGARFLDANSASNAKEKYTCSTAVQYKKHIDNLSRKLLLEERPSDVPASPANSAISPSIDNAKSPIQAQAGDLIGLSSPSSDPEAESSSFSSFGQVSATKASSTTVSSRSRTLGAKAGGLSKKKEGLGSSKKKLGGVKKLGGTTMSNFDDIVAKAEAQAKEEEERKKAEAASLFQPPPSVAATSATDDLKDSTSSNKSKSKLSGSLGPKSRDISGDHTFNNNNNQNKDEDDQDMERLGMGFYRMGMKSSGPKLQKSGAAKPKDDVKAISSNQVFDNSGLSRSSGLSALDRFDGSNSISSSQLFGDQDNNNNSGFNKSSNDLDFSELGSNAQEMVRKIMASDEAENLRQAWNQGKYMLDTAFKQQRLRAWQPLLTPKSVLPTFFIIGIIFAPIGGVLLWAANKVPEVTINYTHCKDFAGDSYQPLPPDSYQLKFSSTVDSSNVKPSARYNTETNMCTVRFQLPYQIDSPVYLYYKLTNFYQNHRRYVKSYNVDQLRGDAVSASTLKGGDCEPLAVRNINNVVKPIYPCGLIANSIFNDTISNFTLANSSDSSDDGSSTYDFSPKGISWSSDKDRYKPSKYKPEDVYPPPNWDSIYPDHYTEDTGLPDLRNDERFQVWMRTAGLPTFRKLYGKNEDQPLKPGMYSFDINMNFDVESFGGTKSIVVSTTSFIGGRNPVLGIAYIVVGGLCVLLGCLFTLRHITKPRRLGDHTYLSWNKQQQPQSQQQHQSQQQPQ